jgi:hypothetical protein
MIVSKLSYEVTDPTIDSQMVTLKGTGADVFFNITTPKFAAQAIKKAAEIGWKPVHYLNNVSASVGSVLTPAGLDNGGIITAVPEGPDRPAVPEGQGVGRLRGLVQEVQRQRRQPGRRMQLQRLRLHRGAGPGAGAQGRPATT